MTMREINQIIEAVFEFNRESVKHKASVELRTNPKDGGFIWLYVFNYEDSERGMFIEFSAAIESGEDALKACKKMADVIAEEKSSAA